MNSFELLVQAIRSYLGLNATGLECLIKAPAQELASFLELVEKHSAQAYVLQGLKNADVLSCLPEDIVELLQNDAAFIAEDNLRLTRALYLVHKVLISDGIDLIALKGPLFSMRMTGGLAQRPFSDIDVLIRKNDVAKALKALTGAGFKAYEPGSIPVSRRTLRKGNEIVLVDQDSNVVELHWQLQPRYMGLRIASDDVWNHSQYIDFFGTEIRHLSDIHELPYFAIHHGGFHRWNEIRYIIDFHQLAGCETLDWRRVWDSAAALGARRPILVGLWVCKKVLGDDVEYNCLSTVEDDPTARQLAELYSRNLAEGDTITGFQKNWWYLRQRSRLQERLAYLPFFLREAVTPNEKDRVTLGRWSVPFLSVPFRFGRLLIKYLRRLLRLKSAQIQEVDNV